MKGSRVAVFFLTFLFSFAGPLFAESVSSVDLLTQDRKYDGQSVTYAGEIVGDIMPRGDHLWLNIFDGKNAIGVWALQSLAGDLKYAGNYKTKGDQVEVLGIFARSCPEHGGDLDIHAQSLRVLTAGAEAGEQQSSDKTRLIIVLFGVIILIWILGLLKLK